MSQALDPPPAAGKSAARRRWLLAVASVLVVLGGLWGLYLLAANRLLSSESVRGKINRRPEKLQIEWGSAWSWWPGHVIVEDLAIRGQSRRARWSAELEHLVLDVDLAALPGRVFHVTRARGRGMVFRYLRPAAPGEVPTDPFQAPIAPLAPREAGRDAAAPETGQRRKWRLRLEGIDLRAVRQVWINRFRIEGEGEAGGVFSLIPGGGPLAVREGFLRWPGSDLFAGAEVITRDFTLAAQFDLDPTVLREVKGREIFTRLSGDFRIAGGVDSLAFLRDLTAGVPNLRIEGGGALDTRLRLAHGRLLEASRLTVEEARLDTEVLGIRVRGHGAVRGDVAEEDGKKTLRLRVGLAEIELAPGAGGGGESWTSAGLEAEIRAVEPDLSEGFRDPALHLDLPDFRLPDMRSWNPYLPTGLGLKFTGGEARVGAHLEASKASVRGDLEISGKGLGVSWKGRSGSADLDAELCLTQGDPRARWLDFTGSRFRLANLRLGDEERNPGPPASASVEVTSGNLIASDPTLSAPGARHLSAAPGARHLSASDEEPPGGEGTGEPASRPEPSPLTGLDRASGYLTISGRLSDLGVLDDVLPTASWLRLGGELELDSQIVLAAGELAPETSALIRAPRLRADFVDLTAEGEGTIRASLGGGGEGSRVSLSLRRAQLRRRGDTLPLLQTPSLDLEATGPPSGAADPFSGRVRAELPPTAEIDLTRVRDLLPAGLPFELRAGRATVGAHFDLTAGSGYGRLRLEAPRISATVRGKPIAGGLMLRLELAHGDLGARTFDLSGSHLDIEGWRSTDAEKPRILDAALDVRSGRLTWAEDDGGAPGVRAPPGRLTLEGRISDLGFFDPFFDVGTWLHLEGAAEVRSDLQLDDRGLAAGSNLEVTADRLVASFVGYRARGLGVVRGELLSPLPEPRSKLDLTLEDAAIFREDDRSPFLHSPSFLLEATGGDLTGEGLLGDLEVRAQLAAADLPDLTTLNVYLPPGGAVRLTSGRGRLGGWVTLSRNRGEGQLDLNAQGVEARIHGFDVSTDFRLEVPLTTRNPTAWTFDLDGARLRLDRTSVLPRKANDEDWWAEVELPRASVRRSRPLELSSEITLSMQDTRPLLELLAQEKKVLRWFDSLLVVRDVTGSGTMEMGRSGFRLDPLEIVGRHFELRSRLHFLDGLETGLFYVRFHKLSAGIAVEDGRRDLKLLNAREWYARRAALPLGPDSAASGPKPP